MSLLTTHIFLFIVGFLMARDVAIIENISLISQKCIAACIGNKSDVVFYSYQLDSGDKFCNVTWTDIYFKFEKKKLIYIK